MKMTSVLLAVSAMAISAPAIAGNSLVSATSQKGIAKSAMSATPDGEWNRLGRRDGKFVELWTKDGDGLNKVTFLGGVPVGESLFRETDRKNKPLPKVSANMLITDIPAILESSYRIQMGVRTMTIDSQEPADFSGHRGIRFTYTFVAANDEVERKGEAIGAIVNNRLYLTAYEAPSIYFFDKDLPAFRQLVSTLKM